jgi:cell division protein FtsZ
VSLDDDPDRHAGQKKTKLSDIGFEENASTEQPTTFEFDNIRSSIYQRSRYNYDEPVVRNDVRDQQRAEEERRLQERENMRRERLRSNVVKLSNPQTINDLESEPAYMRRGVNLDDVPNSAEPAMSKWTISDDDDPELREGNSFLHDNVD